LLSNAILIEGGFYRNRESLLGKQMTPFSRSPVPTPPILYHYTTFHAFQQIVTNKELWASNISYMNDTKEFELAKDIARSILDERLGPLVGATQTPRARIRDRLETMRSVLDGVIATDTFIVSLTEERNQLSQWRAYCKGGGVSIGFNVDSLTRLMEHLGFMLAQCSYDSGFNRRSLRTHIDKTLRLQGSGGKLDDPLATYWRNQLALAAVHMKHPGFAEEREWRLVSNTNPKVRASRVTEYRIANGFLTPFMRLPLNVTYTHPAYDSNWPEVIASVTIGPTANESLAKAAVQGFLTSKGVNMEPLLCGIPLRQL
jgi:hypothetical protein